MTTSCGSRSTCRREAGDTGGFLLLRARTLIGSLAALARGLWEAYWGLQARRATVLLLKTLDDSTLRDIGLARDELPQTCFAFVRQQDCN
jgi:uncharacterized protein YjiS (DUF1127 family)